ncbi:MAG: HDOD domain-containing protein [Verrucomicrobia bacterium]|nr:HDOD domain-containing protein [Verrucomicrobiota bacterium]
MDTKRVLLVGVDLEPFQDLPQRFFEKAPDWEMTFAPCGVKAFAMLDRDPRPFDAAMADHVLPDMRGEQVLDEVKRRYPKALRFVCAPTALDNHRKKQLSTGTHLLLMPCTHLMLLSALQRAFTFQDILPQDRFQELLGSIQNLPSPPAIYHQVLRELDSPTGSTETVGLLIAQDPSLTAKVLQVANSVAYGLHQQVTDAPTAVMHLGVETTKSLILLASTMSFYENLKVAEFNLDSMWHHSLETSRCARAIARTERLPESVASMASTAGLLHDLGKLVLASNLPKSSALAVKIARRHRIPLWDIEQDVLGTSHAEIGAALLHIWGLPYEIAEAVAFHHTPRRQGKSNFGPLAVVHVANALSHEGKSDSQGFVSAGVDLEYLAEFGGEAQVENWRNACVG